MRFVFLIVVINVGQIDANFGVISIRNRESSYLF